MSIVFSEGFDFMTDALMTTRGWSGDLPGTNGATIAPGRYGIGQYGRVGASGGGSIFKNLPSTYTELYSGMALRTSNPAVASTNIFFWRSTSTNTLRLGNNASGQFQLYNSGGTALVTSTRLISSSVWRFVETYLFTNGASGVVEMHIDGTFEASATVNIGSTGINNVGIGFVNGHNSEFDDIWILDTVTPGPTGFQGEAIIETTFPNGAGNTTQFIPSAGSNFQNVDDTTSDSDTTYNASSTVNDLDTYAMGDLTTTSGDVLAVVTNVMARKDGAISTRQIADVVRHSGSDNVGTTQTLSSGYLNYEERRQETPAATPWTIADINAMEVGLKVIA